jgi:hypothetical protein
MPSTIRLHRVLRGAFTAQHGITPIIEGFSSKMVPRAQLKVYKGLPHGMATTHPDVINADLLTFVKA